jgi:hypothetical protein
MRVIYVTTEDHVAIWEESGRAEVWFDDLALWSLEAVDLRIHFIFKFAGEAAEHHLWLQKKAEEEEDAS